MKTRFLGRMTVVALAISLSSSALAASVYYENTFRTSDCLAGLVVAKTGYGEVGCSFRASTYQDALHIWTAGANCWPAACPGSAQVLTPPLGIAPGADYRVTFLFFLDTSFFSSGFSIWADGLMNVYQSNGRLKATTSSAAIDVGTLVADGWSSITLDVVPSEGIFSVYINGAITAVAADLPTTPRGERALLGGGIGEGAWRDLTVSPFEPRAPRSIVVPYDAPTGENRCQVNACVKVQAYFEHQVLIDVRDAHGLSVGAAVCKAACTSYRPVLDTQFCEPTIIQTKPREILTVVMVPNSVCSAFSPTEGLVVATFAHRSLEPVSDVLQAERFRYTTGHESACVCFGGPVGSPKVSFSIPSGTTSVQVDVRDATQDYVAGYFFMGTVTGEICNTGLADPKGALSGHVYLSDIEDQKWHSGCGTTYVTLTSSLSVRRGPATVGDMVVTSRGNQ